MENYFDCCLYFSANELARSMDKLAEQAFKNMDITATQGFTMLLIAVKKLNQPGDIAREMSMNPGTITRFLDVLVKKGYVLRTREGRKTYLSLTNDGNSKLEEIQKCWDEIYRLYSEILGEEFANKVNDKIVEANKIIKNN